MNISGNEVARLVCNAKDPANPTSYLAVEYDLPAAALRVRGPGGVLDEVSPISPPDGSTRLWACRDQTAFYGYVDHVSTLAWEWVGSGVAGNYYGVEGVSGMPIYFDNFCGGEHILTNPVCAHCECACDHFQPRKQLTATIYASGFCSCWDGISVILTWDDTYRGQYWRWIGSASGEDFFCTGGEDTINFYLYCDETTGLYHLCTDLDESETGDSWCEPGGPGGEHDFGMARTSVTCDPFELIFYDVWSISGPLYCYLTVKITE